MTNTPNEVDAYARAHPTRDGGSWAGWCASFVFRAGGFERFYGNAMAAGDASGPLNPDPSKAGRGAIHYWAGVGGDGHVAFEMGGGLLLMASAGVSNYGTALGTITFTDYALKGIPYRGWSYRWGAETLDLSGTAGLPTTPIVTRKESTVALYHKLGTTPLLYALAGGSPGTPANWLETTDPGFATQLAGQAGNSAGLSADSFEAFKRAYLAPVNGAASGTPGAPADNSAILKALADLTAAVVAKPNAPTATAIAEAIILEQKKPGN